ncbi:phage T7 F exclusion suppressor FxsA [Chitinispirillum alkaliphilum]|nr:phage T7 F exclusion suppressor FxsA [Chitinispirillum alkaliphilum]
MFLKLLFLFTIVPLVELYILIQIGGVIGAWNTILAVIATAFLGAALARREGVSTLSKIRLSLARGNVPGDELLDGFLILLAAIVLITPGFFTDLFGFAMLIRPSRKLIKKYIKKIFKNKINKGSMEIHMR